MRTVKKEVENRYDLKRFIEFPYILHKGRDDS